MEVAKEQPAVDLWYVRLPLVARRLGPRPFLALTDGLYVAAWPRAAAVLTPLALLIGLFLGALHPGFRQVFSQSWPMLILAVLLGVMSGHLGALFLLGFAVGDFFLWHTEWLYRGSLLQNLFRIRLPLLIEYALLAFMTTGVALGTKSLLVQLRPPASWPAAVRRAAAFGGHLLLTLLLVFLWTQVVPILIRPVFTWTGGSPPVDAMEILQRGSWPLLLVAALASLARMALQQRALSQPALRARLDRLEATLAAATPSPPLASPLPPIAAVAFGALWATLMLSGVLEAWWQALILLIVLLALHAARAGLLPLPLQGWAALVSRVPAVARLATGIVVVAVLSRLLLGGLLNRTNSFWPILLVTILALFVFYLLDPLPAARAAGQRDVEAS